jgi:uncharacterized protein YbjT (DUF2867 family)
MRCLVTGAHGFIGSEVVAALRRKPSLVIGRGAYGGTSLMRGLAGLPFVLPLPGEGRERIQPIALDDLARGIRPP